LQISIIGKSIPGSILLGKSNRISGSFLKRKLGKNLKNLKWVSAYSIKEGI